MSNRSGPFCRAVVAVLLLLGASAVAASPAASPGEQEGFFQRVENAVGGWLVRLPFGVLLGVRAGSAAAPTNPPAEPVPTSSAEPIEPTSSEPAADDGPHWDPDG